MLRTSGLIEIRFLPGRVTYPNRSAPHFCPPERFASTHSRNLLRKSHSVPAHAISPDRSAPLSARAGDLPKKDGSGFAGHGKLSYLLDGLRTCVRQGAAKAWRRYMRMLMILVWLAGLSFFIKEIIRSEEEEVPKFVAVNRQEYKLKIKLWKNKGNRLTKKKASDNIEKYDSGALCSFLCCWQDFQS